MKAIYINCETREIKEIEVEGSYQAMYKVMGCELIQPIQFDDIHDIHLDEEGFLQHPHRGYMVCAGQLLTGICLILGIKKDGNLKSHNLNLDDIRGQIVFLNKQQAYAYAQEVDRRNAEEMTNHIHSRNRPDIIVCMRLTDLFEGEEK